MCDESLEKLRSLCLALPDTSERMSHGHQTWFVREKKPFASYHNPAHEGRIAFWCAAPPGAQEVLVGADPKRFFRPKYVGHRGWLGVYLDVPQDWDQIADLICDAYREVAPNRLVAQLDADPSR
jgi:predicted DNA-binding protein (MmcQ/YjbR family)